MNGSTKLDSLALLHEQSLELISHSRRLQEEFAELRESSKLLRLESMQLREDMKLLRQPNRFALQEIK